MSRMPATYPCGEQNIKAVAVWLDADTTVLEALTRCAAQPGSAASGDFTFVQISDSHIGFKNVPNMDVTSTFQKAIERITSLANRPAFVLHTGDVSHLSMPDQYDTVDQILKGANFGQDQVYYVPGEHDTFVDNGKAYLDRFGRGATSDGWRSFDFKGVHFVGLVNVWHLKAGGVGVLGDAPVSWPAQDPVVAHRHHEHRPVRHPPKPRRLPLHLKHLVRLAAGADSGAPSATGARQRLRRRAGSDRDKDHPHFGRQDSRSHR